MTERSALDILEEANEVAGDWTCGTTVVQGNPWWVRAVLAEAANIKCEDAELKHVAIAESARRIAVVTKLAVPAEDPDVVLELAKAVLMLSMNAAYLRELECSAEHALVALEHTYLVETCIAQNDIPGAAAYAVIASESAAEAVIPILVEHRNRLH
jgi:hypothetical protein